MSHAQMEVDSDRLAQFAVQVTTAQGTGSGFFVAPGWVLTCAHVVATVPDQGTLTIVPHDSVSPVPLTATVVARTAFRTSNSGIWPWPDQALLSVAGDDGQPFIVHPCPRLDLEGKTPRPDDALQVAGHSPRTDSESALYREIGFTWDGKDKSDYWWLKAGQATPGFSGGMVICRRRAAVVAVMADTRGTEADHGGLASPVAAMSRPEAWPEQYRAVIADVAAAHKQTVVTDISAWRLVFSHADPLIAGALEPWTAIEGQRSPSSVLRPESGVVPYLFREQELARAKSWCEEGPAFAAALLPADGGAGKTRFAIQLAQTMAERGWLAGRVADHHGTADLNPAAIERIALAGLPRLIVVDYAEAVANLRDLITVVAPTATPAAPVRLLALSRTRAGSNSDPLARVTRRGTIRWEDALLDRVDPIGATANLTQDQRKVLFKGAYCAFVDNFDESERLGVPPDVPRLDLTDGRYRLPLEVLFEAFDQAQAIRLGKKPSITDPPVSRVLSHERAYWHKTVSSEYALRNLTQDQIELGVMAATIAGATDRAAAEVAITAVDPTLGDPERRQDLAALIDWLRHSYPGEQALNPLRPDRLGEALCAEVICKSSDILERDESLFHDEDLISRLFSIQDDYQVANVIDLLTRLSFYDQTVACRTAMALLTTIPVLAERSWEQRHGNDAGPGHYTLAQKFQRLLQPEITVWINLLTNAMIEIDPQSDSRHQAALFYMINAELAEETADTGTAERLYKEAESFLKTMTENAPHGELHRTLTICHSRLGRLLRDQGHLDAANQQFARAWELLKHENTLTEGDLEDLSQLAEFYLDLGDNAEDSSTAMQHFQMSLSITGKMLDDDKSHFVKLKYYNRLGNLALNEGDLDAARVHFRDAMSIASARIEYAPTDFEPQSALAICHNRLGVVALRGGDLDGASRHFHEALAILEPLAEYRPNFMSVQEDLVFAHIKFSEVAQARGDWESVHQFHNSALDIAQSILQRNSENPKAAELVTSVLFLMAQVQDSNLDLIRESMIEILEPLSTAGELTPLGGHLWEWANLIE
jgi:tetratricopeptide (TPR) repeat protein